MLEFFMFVFTTDKLSVMFQIELECDPAKVIHIILRDLTFVLIIFSNISTYNSTPVSWN